MLLPPFFLLLLSTLLHPVQAGLISSPLDLELELELDLDTFDAQRLLSLNRAYKRVPDANEPEPALNGTGAGGWQSSLTKAKHIVSQLTIDEKVNLTTGIGSLGRCEGTLGSVHRFAIPEICFQDGPAGIRPTQGNSVFPAGVTTVSTWDRDLFYKKGLALGQQFRGKGINVALQPVTGGPMGRSPYGGRFWEGGTTGKPLSADGRLRDPVLTGQVGYYGIKGTQDAGVIATSKHYIAYEQETFRQTDSASDPFRLTPFNNTVPYSANLDDRTLHEFYLLPFALAVRAGVGAIMCAYNPCENDRIINQILKDELDFQGFVLSDWGATYSTISSANNGLDVDMPGGPGGYFGSGLADSVRNGSVAEWRLDDMVTRLLTQWFLRGQDQGYPKVNYDNNVLDRYFNGTLVNENVVVQQDWHKHLIRQIAMEGITLYKNARTKTDPRGLPLNKPKSLAVFGSDAGPNPIGLNGCDQWIGGSQLCPTNTTSNGTQAVGWGSGASRFPYLIDPLSAIQVRAREDNTYLDFILDDWASQWDADVTQFAADADAALVFVQARSGEDSDRVRPTFHPALRPRTLWDNGDELIKAVASQNNNTIVVMHVVGPVLMDAWWDHPNVTAVLNAHLPGQESGHSLVPILYGDVSPSGKNPYSILSSKDADQYPAIVNALVDDAQVNFTEGLFVDYRQWDVKDITPLVEFGFGLSYTSWDYSDLALASMSDTYASSEVPVDPSSGHGPGGDPALFENILKVSATIKNTGDMAGHEVAQLYVGYPASTRSPPKQLRGFEKVRDVKAGASKTATFELTRKDFSVWDVTSQKWTIEDGTYTIFVGKSSRKIELTKQVTAKGGKISL